MKYTPASVIHTRGARAAWRGIVACVLLVTGATARAQTLLPVCGSPFTSGTADVVLTVRLTPDDQRLFAPGILNSVIAVLDVADSGALTLSGDFPANAGFPTGLATNTAGTRLYVATFGSVVVHEIAMDGTLTQLQVASLGIVGQPSLPFNGIVYVHLPDGDFVYVNNNDYLSPSNLVSALPVLADGTLGAATLVPTGGTAFNSISTVSPTIRSSLGSGARLFVFNGAFGGSNSISSFTIGAGGALALVGSPLALPYSGSGAIAVDLAGAFLYAGTTFGAIGKFAINPMSGALTEVPGSPFATGSLGGVLGLEVDPGGQFVVATIDGQIAILETDTMTPTASSPRPGDAFPIGLAFDSTGTHLFAGNSTPGTVISAYDFGDFAPLELSATVNPRDNVRPSTGTVTLGGTITRSLSTSASLHIDLEQTVGHKHITGAVDAALPCGNGETTWSAAIVGSAFLPKDAVATLTVSAVDPLTNTVVEVGPSTFGVRLNPSY